MLLAPSPVDAPTLAVEGVSKSFRVAGGESVLALRNVDLTVPRGRTLALVGESGSGKTTLGRIVLGMMAADSGRILFDGAPLSPRRTGPERKRIQLVQQNPMTTLNPRRSVFQTIALPLAVHGVVPRSERAARVTALLELVGLPRDIAHRYPRTLSGGQRQRVAIARALASEPELIVLDEPTSALDVSVQARVLRLLLELQERLGVTYLFITHDIAVVRQIAHSMAVLYRGSLVENGPVDRVLYRPLHWYSRLLLSSVPVASDEEELLRPQWPRDAMAAASGPTPATGCSFAPRCPSASGACRDQPPPLATDRIAPDHWALCHNPAPSPGET